MQTFLCYPDFAQSAKVLDSKRLGKQRIEAKQILEINIIKQNPENFIIDGAGFILEKGMQSGQSMYYMPLVEYLEENPNFKIPWENHPAVLMWRNYEYALALYGWIICHEWKSRGYIDNQQPFFENVLKDIPVNWNYNPPIIDINYYPEWYKDSIDLWHVCLSHQSNLLRKDWDYYIKYFGENIQDTTLPYFWPIIKGNVK